MREQLKVYVDRMFAQTVRSQEAQDFHDELLQNTLDRFDDEVRNGHTEQDAYRIAVLSLGNSEELLKPYYPKRQNTGAMRTAGIVLYCTSVVPVILFGAAGVRPSTLGVSIMFLMIAAATMLMILSGRSNPTAEAQNAKTLRAIGVAVVIAGIAVLLLGVGYEEIRFVRLLPVDGAIIGLCGMFCTIAAGIALIVTAGQKDHARTVPQVPTAQNAPAANAAAHSGSQPVPEQEMQPALPKGLRIALGIMSAIYWVAVVIVFLAVSVTTGAWYYTWLVFVLAGGLYNIVDGIVKLCCGMQGLRSVFEGILDIGAGVLFFYLTYTTGMWYVTWLVFPIAGCLTGVIDGIIRLTKVNGRETNEK